jgi:hypothetical protein
MSNRSDSRSTGTVILTVITGIAGVLAVLDVLRFLGLLPATFGRAEFFGVSIVGAILSVIMVSIWFWSAGRLWQRDRQGWAFVVFVAVMYLILNISYYFGGTPLGALLPSFLISALVLFIAYRPGTKKDFGRI